MSGIIIDRTVEKKSKSSSNRAKFVKRASQRIKEAVKEYITNDADIKSISDGKSKRINVPKKTFDENIIHHDRKANRKQVVIGNKNYEAGDTIPKPPDGGTARGRQGGEGEESEDDFYFTLTHKEFLDIFFDGLELPDLVRKQLSDIEETRPQQMGFSSDGPPIRLDLRRTMINSIKRTTAITGTIHVEIEDLQKKLEESIDEEEKAAFVLAIEDLQSKLDTIPFLQEFDLRYRRIENVPVPITKAVMFCIMDVSGSMTQWHKEMAKRFFMILYLFLTRQYENVELVFIKHHHEAFEVDEQNFFYSRESGGTVVSKALELTQQILKKRYPSNLYNSYICQISDGDNWGDTNEMGRLVDSLDVLLPAVQYFAFVDVKDPQYSTLDINTTLMEQYEFIKDTLEEHNARKMNLRSIFEPEDIYKVFRSLFSKDSSERHGD